MYGASFEAKDGIKIVAQSDSTGIVTDIEGSAFTGTRSEIYIDASNSSYMGRLIQYGVTIANNGDTVPMFMGGTEGTIYSKKAGLGDKKLIVFSGGMFNEDPSAYLAEGKTVHVSDGMYRVIDNSV